MSGGKLLKSTEIITLPPQQTPVSKTRVDIPASCNDVEVDVINYLSDIGIRHCEPKELADVYYQKKRSSIFASHSSKSKAAGAGAGSDSSTEMKLSLPIDFLARKSNNKTSKRSLYSNRRKRRRLPHRPPLSKGKSWPKMKEKAKLSLPQ